MIRRDFKVRSEVILPCMANGTIIIVSSRQLLDDLLRFRQQGIQSVMSSPG